MSDQDAFERIMASLSDAMLDETQWPATSALIDEACGAKGNAILVSEGPKDDVRSLFIGLYYRGQRREDLEREYLDSYYPTDESIPRLQELPDSRLVHTTALYTAEELKTSPTYNESLVRASAQHGLHVRLDGPGGFSVIWAIADPVSPGGWGSTQLALFKGLLPHIRQYVRVRQALGGAEALSTTLTDLLDTPRIGVIHLDRRGRIVAANDRARATLQHGDAVSDQGGFLRARAPADHVRLERLVAGALPSATAAVGGAMLLRRTSALPSFIVHVKPVGAGQSDFGAGHIAVLVLITELGRQSRIDPAPVAASLGLAQVESQVAVWLAEGRTVGEIAAATECTEASVYRRLGQICHKLDIFRQADLVRLVLSVAEFP